MRNDGGEKRMKRKKEEKEGREAMSRLAGAPAH